MCRRQSPAKSASESGSAACQAWKVAVGSPERGNISDTTSVLWSEIKNALRLALRTFDHAGIDDADPRRHADQRLDQVLGPQPQFLAFVHCVGAERLPRLDHDIEV